MKREDILAIYTAGPEVVIKLINSLTAIIAKLEEQVTELKERVKTLENRQSKNTRNRSKLPSTEG